MKQEIPAVKYRLHTHYSAGHSPVHDLDPRTKIIVTLAYTILVVSTPPTICWRLWSMRVCCRGRLHCHEFL